MAFARLLSLLLLALPAFPDTPTPPRCPSGMVLIPAGTFQFGPTGESPEDPYFAPASPHTLPALCLDAREVSVAEFKKFAQPAQNGECPPQSDPRRSVNCVTYTQAAQFCQSARSARLPTEVEWEFAARGPASHPFPWGRNEITFNPRNPNLCLLRQEPTGSLGPCIPASHSADRSPQAVFDLAFNLSEWTSSLFPSSSRRIIRGGNWTLRQILPVATQRSAREESYFNSSVGFRCAANPR